MSVIFSEDIGKIRVVNSDGMDRVVHVVQYRISCETDGENVLNIFDVSLPSPDPSKFISYDQLTKEQVLGWVRSSIGEQELSVRKEAMIAMLNQKLAARKETPQEIAAPW